MYHQILKLTSFPILFFSIFWPNFFCPNPQKSHFLIFGNDHTVIVQYKLVTPHTTKHYHILVISLSVSLQRILLSILTKIKGGALGGGGVGDGGRVQKLYIGTEPPNLIPPWNCHIELNYSAKWKVSYPYHFHTKVFSLTLTDDARERWRVWRMRSSQTRATASATIELTEV